MATVWEAVDEVLARRVAVKVLHPHLASDDQFVARFRREAVAAARLSHPAIVSIYDTCSEGGTDAIVMELVRGTTLRGELDRRGRFDVSEASAIVAEIADALACAHAAGIIHRDVKPANVLLSDDGRVLVTDFGIAKAGDGLDLTGTNTTLGTAKYLAPEQVEGRPVDARTDVYAAGVILYELLCGRPPFVAEGEAATALARLHRDPEPPTTLRPELEPPVTAVVLRALARDPGARFADATAFRDAVRAAAGDAARPSVRSTAFAPAVDAADATRALADATMAAPNPTPPTPAAPVGPPAPPPEARRSRRRPRGRAPYVVGGLVAAAVGTVLVLLAQSGDGRDGGGQASAGTRPPAGDGGLAIASVDDFDPSSDDQAENPDMVGNLLDGDPGTFWRTQCYRSASLEGFKPGVGFILDLGTQETLGELVLGTTTPGWSGEVHVADDPATWSDPENLGDASATIDALPAGPASVPLDGAEGRYVLLWITGFGQQPSSDCDANPFGVSITEVSVLDD